MAKGKSKSKKKIEDDLFEFDSIPTKREEDLAGENRELVSHVRDLWSERHKLLDKISSLREELEAVKIVSSHQLKHIEKLKQDKVELSEEIEQNKHLIKALDERNRALSFEKTLDKGLIYKLKKPDLLNRALWVVISMASIYGMILLYRTF